MPFNVASINLRGRIGSRYVGEYHGHVEIYNSKRNQYEYICDKEWDINDAHVVCRMLGFPGALDATVRSEYGQPLVKVARISNFQCNGTENSIFDCPYEVNLNLNCPTSRSAGVKCLCKLSTIEHIIAINVHMLVLNLLILQFLYIISLLSMIPKMHIRLYNYNLRTV